MPHPLHLQIMGISINEYNSYSPKKKARFQKVAQEKLTELHEGDIEGYVQLTKDAVNTAASNAIEAADAEEEDREGE